MIVGCSSSQEAIDSADRNRLEEILHSPIEVAFEGEYGDLVALCMEANGFDGFRLDAPAEPTVVVPGNQDLATAQTDEEFRAALAAGGSGLITALFSDDDDQPGGEIVLDPAANEPFNESSSSDVDRALYIRAGVSPREDVGAESGCLDFARTALILAHPEFANVRPLVNEYGDVMAEFFATPEAAAIHDQWLSCMREAGFSDIRDSGSELEEDLMQRAERLRSEGLALESTAVQELIEEDKKLSLAWFDCDERVAERRQALQNEAAEAFVEKNRDVVEALLD